jgi:hypothetical protein
MTTHQQFEADRLELGADAAVALLLQTPYRWDTLAGRIACWTVAVATSFMVMPAR